MKVKDSWIVLLPCHSACKILLLYDMDYKCILVVSLGGHIGAMKSEVYVFSHAYTQKIGNNHSAVEVYNYTYWLGK